MVFCTLAFLIVLRQLGYALDVGMVALAIQSVTTLTQQVCVCVCVCVCARACALVCLPSSCCFFLYGVGLSLAHEVFAPTTACRLSINVKRQLGLVISMTTAVETNMTNIERIQVCSITPFLVPATVRLPPNALLDTPTQIPAPHSFV